MQQPNNRQQIALLVCFLVMIGGIYVNSLIWPAPPKKVQEVAPQEVVEAPPVKPAEQPEKKDPPPRDKPKNDLPRQRIRLGDASSNLAVMLDSRGGSVYRIVLNKFQQADEMGRPVFIEGDKKRPEPLEFLIGDKNEDVPSNLLYHFDPNKESDSRPIATLGEINWKMLEPEVFDANKVYSRVVFQAEVAGVKITKTYSLENDDYHIGLEVKLENVSKEGKRIPFRYQLTSGHGLRLEGEWYTSIFRNALILRQDDKGTPWRSFQELRSIALRAGGDEVTSNPSENKFITYGGVALQYFASMLVVADGQDRTFIKSARPTLELATIRGRLKKKGIRDFTVETSDNRTRTFVIDRDHPVEEELEKLLGQEVGVVSRTDAHDNDVALQVLPVAQTNPLFLDDIVVRLNTKTVELKPDEPVVHKYLLYNGPVKVRLLGHLEGNKAIPDPLLDRYLDKLRLDTLTDYHFQGSGLGWFSENIFSPIGLTRVVISVTNLMHGILTFIHRILPGQANYGFCIIILTILIRGMMFPVSRKMAMTSVRMQALAPELKKLQEKYKDDPQGRTRAQMELYRKNNVSPLGSCWMVFIQMPIFLGLYYALQESIHFRLAPFMWIVNLAAPDMLIPWGDSIPFISRPESHGGFFYLGPFFNLLPVIAVAFMMVQQKMTMPPAVDEQTAMQQKMMKYMMVFMGLMFYKVAAGLCLYFIASSIWGFTERKLLPKRKKGPAGETTEQKLSLLQKAVNRFQSEKGPDSSTNGDSNGSPSAVSRPTSNGDTGKSVPLSTAQARRNKRKAVRNKLKGGYDSNAFADSSSAPSAQEEPPITGLFGGLRTRWRDTRRRLSEWWEDVLEQAKKK